MPLPDPSPKERELEYFSKDLSLSFYPTIKSEDTGFTSYSHCQKKKEVTVMHLVLS